MDRSLQKKILSFIKDEGGICDWNTLLSGSDSFIEVVFESGRRGHVADIEEAKLMLKHNLDLLADEDKVSRIEQLTQIYYLIKPRGYHELDPLSRRWLRVILWEKHNLIAILALAISIIALFAP